MTDEERMHMITEQLLIVRDNLFRGMSKSIQKLQARSINEVLELENFTQSLQRTMDKPTAWYDPTNHHVSTDKNDPLFTPLGQVWPLYPKREWVGLTDELREGAEPMFYCGAKWAERILKEKST